MLNLGNDHASPNSNPPFKQWLQQTLGRSAGRIQFRQRGNHFHLLCESTPCPDQIKLLSKLLPALQHTDFNGLLPDGQPRVYQIILYGRAAGQHNPSWTAPIDLNHLDYYLQQLQPARAVLVGATVDGSPTGRVGVLETEEAIAADSPSLLHPARQGQPEAIARYLSESLTTLGIAVHATIRKLPQAPQAVRMVDEDTEETTRSPIWRLWLVCEAPYNIEASVIAEPIAQKLRELALEGFRDAVVQFRVLGEVQPDWMLRVDLTPTDEVLREAARWGDVEAITRLLNQSLSLKQLELLSASLQESTLHLFCSSSTGTTTTPISPDQTIARQTVSPLLEDLAPQGIHAAMLYGQVAGQDSPTWVEWMTLPAASRPNLAEPALTLAKQGNWEAIAFLLGRLLNPNLDRQLATGGIRLQLLPRGDLLHVMGDGTLCPDRQRTGPVVARFVRELALPSISGVRVYGRRSGQKVPLWSYGSDFVQRDRLVPEAAPEFVATADYVSDLMGEGGDLVHRPEITPVDLQNAWTRFWQNAAPTLRSLLLRSQVFLPSDVPADPSINRQVGRLAAIWGAVGLLLAVQLDWGLGRLLREPNPQVAVAASPVPSPPAPVPPSPSVSAAASPEAMPLPNVPLNRSGEAPSGAFNESGFTRQSSPSPSPASVPSPASPAAPLPFTAPDPQSQAIAASVLSAELPFPTFNSRQLNEKLMLYTEQLRQSGPPDVLIIGSSRALRGVDPAALRKTLDTLGYRDVTVFNFGINGATAQVVDLILRQLLQPDQLPRLIIWADGARAFNSGTVDVTYNGIVVSEGYRQLSQGTLARPVAPGPGMEATASPSELPNAGVGASLSDSYAEMDRWLSDRLAGFSTAFEERDRVKNQFQTWLTALFPLPAAPTPPSISPPLSPNPQTTQSLSEEARDLIDFEGFLPLSVQFNPATYYQEYARVAGQYDSDYADFRLGGNQAEAFRQLLQFTRSRNIPVVFVNTPLTDEYLDPFRQEKEEEFRQFMLQESLNQPGFVFRDLGEIWLKDYDYFSDPSHLNRYGAYQVSRRLAQDPMIPWGQVTP